MIDITKPLMFENESQYTCIRLVGTLTDGSIIIEVYLSSISSIELIRFNSDGTLYGDNNNSIKLINVPEPPIEFWVNMYSDISSVVGIYTSKEQADSMASKGRVKCMHVREVK